MTISESDLVPNIPGTVRDHCPKDKQPEMSAWH